MKIALSTSVIQRGRSGVGQYVLALVRALLPAAARHEFTLYVLEDDLPLFRFADGPMRLEPVAERHRPPVRNIAWHQRELPRRLLRERTDVLHVPSYRRMLWPRPCARVATIHDLAPFHLSGKYDWARMIYGRVIARQLARRQDEIAAISGTTARDIERFFGISGDRITVVPNGVDHERFCPGSSVAARAAVCPELQGGPFFLYVARLEHPAKNHVRLIEAFDRFKALSRSDWRLVLAGSDWHGAEAVHARIHASPFARDIVARGFVPAADLPAWYRAADVLVFPSLYEGFGLPPIEAMACGCPVLSSTRGALEETVGRAAGLLDPENLTQLQAQLSRAASDGAWRGKLRAAGLARAQAFNWNKSAEAMLAVYARAIERKAERDARAARPYLARRPRQA